MTLSCWRPAAASSQATTTHSVFCRADAYVSDVATPPVIWADGLSLAEAIAAGVDPHRRDATHERQWHTNRLASLRSDATRLFEGLAARLPG